MHIDENTTQPPADHVNDSTTLTQYIIEFLTVLIALVRNLYEYISHQDQLAS